MGCTREVPIPAGSTLTFFIELLRIDGKGAMQDVEALAADPQELCDACATIVEEFHKDWAEMIEQRHRQHTMQGDGGQFSLEYDGELEKRVWAHCERKAYTTTLATHSR